MTNNKNQMIVDLKRVHEMVANCSCLQPNNPQLVHIIRPLAFHHIEVGDYQSALPLQQTIFELAQQHPNYSGMPAVSEARLALAKTLHSLKLYDQAIPLFQALAAEADADSSNSSLVDCLRNVGRFPEAIAVCEFVLARLDQSTALNLGAYVSWLMNLSRCYSNQGDFASAAQVTERTIPLLAARAEVVCIPQLDVLAELYRQAGNQAEHDRVRALRRDIAVRHDY